MAVVSFPTGVPAVVPVGEPGVIIANQSTPSYATAQAILAGIHQGEDAQTALDKAIANDFTRQNRQFGVAVLDPNSPTGVSVATYTGSAASQQRCGLTGDTYAVQANLQTSDQVCAAMAKGFERTTGSLAQRLLAAMAAGSQIGGDSRGEYSATLRVYSTRWEFASYTPIAVSSNVERSADWYGDLKFGTAAYQSFWTRGDPADRVELTTDLAATVQGVLEALGYFHGTVDGNWGQDSEFALQFFSQRNLAFTHGTRLDQGVRYIDGPLTDYLVAGYKRGVLVPSSGGAPGAADSHLHTRSIVAADPATGQVGMAVVSFPTGVPAVVPVGEPGVIIANQSTPSYATAQAILAGIHQGEDAQTALDKAIANDLTRQNRQLGVAVLDPNSPTGVSVANYTGSAASQQRCDLTGDTYAVQANLQTSDQVCAAMAKGFDMTTGSLAQRLLAAMAAGSQIGGDSRGEYSATLKIYSTRWEFASYTPIAVWANVDRSADWYGDLKFSTDAFQSFWTRGDPADRVELTTDLAASLQGVLQALGYFHGAVDGNWGQDSETALVSFSQRNVAFTRRTTVDQDVRYIDGPLADYMVSGYDRGVLIASPGGAPGQGGTGGDDMRSVLLVAASQDPIPSNNFSVTSATSFSAIRPVGLEAGNVEAFFTSSPNTDSQAPALAIRPRALVPNEGDLGNLDLSINVVVEHGITGLEESVR
jgi:uncharacterized Ntn-hydrolase superfamily protein